MGKLWYIQITNYHTFKQKYVFFYFCWIYVDAWAWMPWWLCEGQKTTWVVSLFLLPCGFGGWNLAMWREKELKWSYPLIQGQCVSQTLMGYQIKSPVRYELSLFELLACGWGSWELSNITGCYHCSWILSKTQLQDPFAEDTIYLGYRMWRNQVGTNWKLHLYWLNSIMLEWSMYTTGVEKKSTVLLSCAPWEWRYTWLGKICPLVQ